MTSEQKNEPKLISASRRTDIPRFYARWFGERRRHGFAESRTAFGVAGRVSLRRADVLGFLFWTRDAGPFMKELEALRVEGIPYTFQFTINGYGRELEPRRPKMAEAIESFLAVSSSLKGPVPTGMVSISSAASWGKMYMRAMPSSAEWVIWL